jgi:tetratricopeptide (TPR) repeat protein
MTELTALTTAIFWQQAQEHLKEHASEDAILKLEQLLEENPRHRPALVLLSTLYQLQSQPLKAIQVFMRLSELEMVEHKPFQSFKWLCRGSSIHENNTVWEKAAERATQLGFTEWACQYWQNIIQSPFAIHEENYRLIIKKLQRFQPDSLWVHCEYASFLYRYVSSWAYRGYCAQYCAMFAEHTHVENPSEPLAASAVAEASDTAPLNVNPTEEASASVTTGSATSFIHTIAVEPPVSASVSPQEIAYAAAPLREPEPPSSPQVALSLDIRRLAYIKVWMHFGEWDKAYDALMQWVQDTPTQTPKPVLDLMAELSQYMEKPICIPIPSLLTGKNESTES